MTAGPAAERRIDAHQARAGLRWNIAAILASFVGIGLALADADMFWPPVVSGGVLCGLLGNRAWGFADGFRQGTALAAVTLARKINERASDAPSVDPNLPGLVALREAKREANARIEGWSWCEEHKKPRYDGPYPCDRIHRLRPAARVCRYHGRAHGPGEFGALCQAWDAVAEDGQRRWYLRWPRR